MGEPRGIVLWFTGLPASGKSTLATRVRDLVAARRSCVVLDSDALREALEATTYGDVAREGFYRSLANLAALIARQGHVVLVAATAPLRVHREHARAVAPEFVEIWVRTPLAACEARDPKGLYARARAGDAPRLPGVGAPYEAPPAPDVTAEGGLDEAAAEAIARLVP